MRLINKIKHVAVTIPIIEALFLKNIIKKYKYNALYNSVYYEYNEMSNIHNDIKYNIDKYCIKQEEDEIFAHTHNISIDDVRVAIKH